MADASDVADALVGAIAAIVYPNGTDQPSLAGVDVQVFQGWPDPSQLEDDLRATDRCPGAVKISVFPTASEREVTRHMGDWQTLNLSLPTIALGVVANVVTITGTGAGGQNAALLVNGLPYVYPVQANDTPTSIATALATLINAKTPASSSGPVITIVNPRSISPRMGGTGTSIRELRRQEKVFQISIWANSPDVRDPLASKVDAALAGISRMTFADGYQGVLRYRSSVQFDAVQKAGIYRRDFLYAVEYSITETSFDTQIVVEQLNVSVPAATQSISVYS